MKFIATLDVEIHAHDAEDAEDQATALLHSIKAPYGEAYLIDITAERFEGGKTGYYSVFE